MDTLQLIESTIISAFCTLYCKLYDKLCKKFRPGIMALNTYQIKPNCLYLGKIFVK